MITIQPAWRSAAIEVLLGVLNFPEFFSKRWCCTTLVWYFGVTALRQDVVVEILSCRVRFLYGSHEVVRCIVALCDRVYSDMQCPQVKLGETPQYVNGESPMIDEGINVGFNI